MVNDVKDAITPPHYYAFLREEKDNMEVQMKILERKLATAEADLLAWMSDQNLPSVTLDDGTKLTRSEKIWASVKPAFDESGNPVMLGDKMVKNTALAAEALRAANLSHFITENFNTNTVSAYVREVIASGEELHPAILSTFDIVTKPTISRRKRG
jgi:hypothetical protein